MKKFLLGVFLTRGPFMFHGRTRSIGVSCCIGLWLGDVLYISHVAIIFSANTGLHHISASTECLGSKTSSELTAANEYLLLVFNDRNLQLTLSHIFPDITQLTDHATMFRLLILQYISKSLAFCYISMWLKFEA